MPRNNKSLTVEDLWKIERIGAPSLSPDGTRLFGLARQFLRQCWCGGAVTHVQVTAAELRPGSGQLE